MCKYSRLNNLRTLLVTVCLKLNDQYCNLNPLHCFLFLISFCELLCWSLQNTKSSQNTKYDSHQVQEFLLTPQCQWKVVKDMTEKRNWLTKAQFMLKTSQSIWTVGRSTERAKTMSDWTYRSTAGQHDFTEQETEVLEATSHFGPFNIIFLEVTILKQSTLAFLTLATDLMCS